MDTPKVVRKVAFALLLVACGGEDGEELERGVAQQAIINGDLDAGDPAVVALVLTGEIYCSGVLVSRNVVLTAAHCVKYAPPDYVFFGSNPKDGGRSIGVARVSAHPRFNDGTLRHDVGLIELSEDGPAVPIEMAAAPIDDSSIGREIRLVGFGVPRPGATKELAKRTGKSNITDVTGFDFRFHATPARTCLGDSGGPSFVTIEGREVVLGVTSSGDLNCKVYGRHMRVDRYRDFIDPFIAEASVIHYRGKGSGCQASTSQNETRGDLLVSLAALFWLGHRRTRGEAHPPDGDPTEGVPS